MSVGSYLHNSPSGGVKEERTFPRVSPFPFVVTAFFLRTQKGGSSRPERPRDGYGVSFQGRRRMGTKH